MGVDFMFKKIIKWVLIAILIPVIAFSLFLIYMTVTDYKPEEKIPLSITDNHETILKRNMPFTILTFNIGYCGLDKNQDFFMDGGTMSRSSSYKKTDENLKAITRFIKDENPTFALIQEIDINSSRSYHINELKYMQQELPLSSVFALNYKVPFVPVPLNHPMGSVYAGNVTFSSFKTISASRYQYPGSEKWPKQMFDLDRCFTESIIPVDDGKNLILVNSHLSAFDKGGEIRKVQLNYLKEYILTQYSRGNYVIVGGDWNHSLPGTDPKQFKSDESWPFWLQKLPDDFAPVGFKWAADSKTPSVRTVASEYRVNHNFLAVIDGFLVSPNVEIIKVTVHQLDFENSDHNPVTAELVLK